MKLHADARAHRKVPLFHTAAKIGEHPRPIGNALQILTLTHEFHHLGIPQMHLQRTRMRHGLGQT